MRYQEHQVGQGLNAGQWVEQGQGMEVHVDDGMMNTAVIVAVAVAVVVAVNVDAVADIETMNGIVKWEVMDSSRHVHFHVMGMMWMRMMAYRMTRDWMLLGS